MIFAIAVGIYAGDYYKVTDASFRNAIVQETDDYILYGDSSSKVGFIFYPGAKVEADCTADCGVYEGELDCYNRKDHVIVRLG